ncbi:hypothetical protein GCM10022415_04320 [Knoellia locipacati]
MHLALRDGEGEAVEGDGAAERLAQVLGLDDAVHDIERTPVSQIRECSKLSVCRLAQPPLPAHPR